VAGLLVLIDGNSLVHRAYHALPELSTSGGRSVGAVYGFAQTVLKLLEEHPPDFAAVAFDSPGKTFRHEQFPAYKANRPPTPPDLSEQFELVREFADTCGLASVEAPGYEADDIIGTLARAGADAGMDVLVVSIDRDCLQLIDDRVRVLSPSRGPLDAVMFDEEEVQRKYGYRPSQVADAKSLIGDPSDNIPGVPGIGKKTAASLLAEYESVEEILKHASDIRNRGAREYVESHPDAVVLARDLATIDTRVPVGVGLDGLEWPGLDAAKLRALLVDLEFTRLLDRLPDDAEPQVAETDAALDSADAVVAWCEELAAQSEIGLCSVTHRDAFLGLALAVPGGLSRFIPANLLLQANGQGLFDQPSAEGSEGDVQRATEAAARILGAPEIAKCGGGLKRQVQELRGVGLELRGLGFDPELASYVLEPHRYSHSVQVVAADRLQQRLGPLVATAEARPHAACEWAEASLALEGPLRAELGAAGLLKLFDEVEVPLTGVLLKMEQRGVAVDVEKLEDLSRQMGERLEKLAEEIHEHAGGQFNIDSPRQLGEVLFEKLGLPVQKRTKTGPSTDAEVLEKLRDQHPIVDLVSEYRSFAKLRSTYVESLAQLAREQGGRVHTTFEQTVVATGRLSSRDPNLQNIPIRTEWGGRIRSCFIAGSPDLRLMSADYSQIELRLLAHFSQDPNLLAAFRAGEDIHERTASEIFEVPMDEVTPEMRRQAKTVNFAVIYGMGPVALSQEIGVSREEAARFIENYFGKLPGVKGYLARTLETAREQGYVQTLMGRRRAFPELHSQAARERAYAERSAVNSPLQGTAADVIKVAMVRLDQLLEEREPACRMLLQVHDELLFELPEGQIDEVARLCKEVMEGACELDVPLIVDVSVGENWRDLTPVQLAGG
jgi:DNA polymerase-1